jgi:hypothetical protein
MNYLKWLFTLLTILFISPITLANNNDIKQKCADKEAQATAALVAEDWVLLERISYSHAKTCKNVLNGEDISMDYEDIATANFHLRKLEKVLIACDVCTSIYYSNTGCLLTKAQTLGMLGRLPEARNVLAKAERIIKFMIAEMERAHNYTTIASVQEIENLKLAKLEAEQQWAFVLHKRFFGH